MATAREIALQILVGMGERGGDAKAAIFANRMLQDAGAQRAAVLKALKEDITLFREPALRDKPLGLPAWGWLETNAGLKLSPRELQAIAINDIQASLIRDKLVKSIEPDGTWKIAGKEAGSPAVALDNRVQALIRAEIERSTSGLTSTDDASRVSADILKRATEGGWLTKTAEELAAGPLKAAAEHIKAQEKRYRPEARDLLAEFASPGPAARPGPAGSIKVGPDGAFSIDLGRFKSTTGTAVENTEADARSHARVSSNFLELMRASAAADPAKFKLNGEIPKMPADLRDPAAVARYNTEVAAFMKGNADALKALRAAGVVGDSGTVDFAALKKAGVDARAVAAVAAAPEALRAQAEQMLAGLGELVDNKRGNDAAALERLGIKRSDVGAPDAGNVFATSRASHDAVRRASAILAEQGVTEASLAAARAAAAEALKGGVRVATARDEAATNTAATLPALKVAQDKVAATTRAG